MGAVSWTQNARGPLLSLSSQFLIKSNLGPFSLSLIRQWQPLPLLRPAKSSSTWLSLANRPSATNRWSSLMEKVSAADKDELTVEEKNILSVPYENVIGACHASWCIISSIEKKEDIRQRLSPSRRPSWACDFCHRIHYIVSLQCFQGPTSF